jgi:hypothetical protein
MKKKNIKHDGYLIGGYNTDLKRFDLLIIHRIISKNVFRHS